MIPKHYLPKIVTILREGYTRAALQADLIAGLTVAVVALPLSMALAIASGASPDKGLLTAVVAGGLISLLGGSRVQIGGPTGAFVVVVFNVIAQHGYDGLILATLMAGFILLIAGYAKFGQIIKFIPHPVVTGFTTGIAVIIASSQVKDFLGLNISNIPADFLPKWGAYFSGIGTTSLPTLLIGLGSLSVILTLRKFAPKWPGYLIAVVLGAGVVAFFNIPIATIGSRFPDIPSGLPLPTWPVFTYAKFKEVLPSSFVIAFLAGIEALLSAMVADGMTGFKHRPNQELVGMGFANIATALFGGLPATGAIARTATNIKAGGRTPFAGVFHAVFVLLFMLFAMPLMKYVPMATLAAILFTVAWGMSELHHFLHIIKLSPFSRTILLITFFLTVLVDLTMAISVGVTLSSLVFMRQMSKSVEISTHGRRKTDLSSDSSARDTEDQDQRLNLPKDVEIFRIVGPLFFGVADDLIDALKNMGRTPKVLILMMRLVPYLDSTGVTVLENLTRQCEKNGTRIIFCALQKQPREILERGDVHSGEHGVIFCADHDEAIALAQKMTEEPAKA